MMSIFGLVKLTEDTVLYTIIVSVQIERLSAVSGAMKEKKQPLVRIDSADKAILDQLSEKTGESMPRLLHRAVTFLKKEIFFQQMNGAYRDMRKNQSDWDAEMEERALFDKSVGDGMEL